MSTEEIDSPEGTFPWTPSPVVASRSPWLAQNPPFQHQLTLLCLASPDSFLGQLLHVSLAQASFGILQHTALWYAAGLPPSGAQLGGGFLGEGNGHIDILPKAKL